jgi:chemotaxis protein CheD
MDRRIPNDRKLVLVDTHFLEPGYVFFTQESVTIRTVLGSCVAVTMWDRRLRCGGMNHFLYPIVFEKNQATPKYGNVAVSVLIRLMLDAGCKVHDIEAQIIGGAFPKNDRGTNIGLENVKVARRLLAKRGISVLSEDIGGILGRKLVFDIGTGEVAVLKVHRLRRNDWVKRVRD